MQAGAGPGAELSICGHLPWLGEANHAANAAPAGGFASWTPRATPRESLRRPRRLTTTTRPVLPLQPFDLSSALFVATANRAADIPAPLLDRLEVVQLGGYTLEEKVSGQPQVSPAPAAASAPQPHPHPTRSHTHTHMHTHTHFGLRAAAASLSAILT